MVVLDNLSYLPDWLSDSLCRLAAGGGFATRELYSDADEAIFDAQRPIILNGIEDIVRRDDLRDRTIDLVLPVIGDDHRIPEKVFWERFERQRPLLLGALLDAVAESLRKEDSVKLVRLPRMADFAVRAVAAEGKFGVEAGTFLKAYEGNRSALHEQTIEDSLIGPLIKDIANKGFSGTATDLLDRLNKLADDETKRTKGWPKRPNTVSGALRRLAPSLRAMGVEVYFDRESDTHRKKVIEIRKVW
jgi:hypothetical protein